VQLPVLDRRAHVDQVDLAVLAQVGKLPGADGRDAHGDLFSFLESRFVWSWALAGVELDPQAPLIQVFTPRRGSTHA
jgi:hypothetical protein